MTKISGLRPRNPKNLIMRFFGLENPKVLMLARYKKRRFDLKVLIWSKESHPKVTTGFFGFKGYFGL
jgi:hypothetical protein